MSNTAITSFVHNNAESSKNTESATSFQSQYYSETEARYNATRKKYLQGDTTLLEFITEQTRLKM